MANEHLYSGLADLRAAEVLSREIQLLLADRASLRNHPAIIRLEGPFAGGSTVLSVPAVGLMGYDEMGAVAEGSASSNTALTDTSYTITLARQALQRQASDIAMLTQGQVGPALLQFAEDMVMAAEMRLTSMLCNVLDDFSASVGTTTVNLSVDDVYDAITTLEVANTPGGLVSILHPQQIADFQEALRSEGGAVQYLAATAEMLAAKGQGYVGSWLGVDFFKSSRVPTANGGADRAGSMFARGAVGYAEASSIDVGQLGIPQGAFISSGPILVEFERDAAYSYNKMVGNYYAGVSLFQDAMGVSIITDA